MYSHSKRLNKAGVPVSEAAKVLIMLHGRGAEAASFIKLERELQLAATAIIAPQATNNSWYPYSFLAPVEDNQPSLGSALQIIGEIVEDITAEGITMDRVYFLGFSQGACLALEYVARNPKRYGGVIAFTGGLIGEKLDRNSYKGNFSDTPVLITTGDPDAHVPLLRVQESATILSGLGANVSMQVYEGRPHTITLEELELARTVLNHF